MIKQDFMTDTPSVTHEGKNHIWEVRHAGLLGIKYEVAVRSDLFDRHVKEEGGEFEATGREVLRGVVDAAILGCVGHMSRFYHYSWVPHLSFFSLGDDDDDVRSVAASCLLPVAGHLVEQLPESLGQVLLVLWRCLSNMKDDLSSSVGAVMDLLGSQLIFI